MPAEHPSKFVAGSLLKQLSTCGRRQQEVLVAQIRRQVVSGDEARDLLLDLCVGQAVGHRGVRRTLTRRVRVRVDQHAAERHVVVRDRAGQVVVLRPDRVDVLVTSVVVGEVIEVAGNAGHEPVRIGPQSLRAPHQHVVGIRRHHRTAVVVHVVEREVERGRPGWSRAQRLIGHRLAVGQTLEDCRGARRCYGRDSHRPGEDQRHQQSSLTNAHTHSLLMSGFLIART